MCTYIADTQYRSRDHLFPWKSVCTTYSEWVFVALGIQHAKRMRCYDVNLWPIRFYYFFLHYLTNGTIFENKKRLLNTKCVFWSYLQLLSETFLSRRILPRVFTLDAGLLARSQYPEGPVTGHLDTGFSRFPCAYKQTLRRFPTFQVATTCFSCSPPDLKSVVTNFMFCLHVK